MDEGLVSDVPACRYRGRSAAVSLFLAWALFLASPLLRYSLCRLAQRSHLVWPWRGGSWHSRHLVGPPASIFSARAMARLS